MITILVKHPEGTNKFSVDQIHADTPKLKADMQTPGAKAALLLAIKKYLAENYPEPPRKYQTHTLPHYVKNYLGNPVWVERQGEWFHFYGSEKTVSIKSKFADAARKLCAKKVAEILGLKDGRVKKGQ